MTTYRARTNQSSQMSQRAEARFKSFILALDNFYEEPAQVVQAAQTASYHKPEHCTGYRSQEVYHPPGIRRRLERLLGLHITRWDRDPVDENGVFYQAFASGSRKEVPGVHADFPHTDLTTLIYLTPGLPVDCGTSLWQHAATGLTSPPTVKDARRLGIPLQTLRDLMDEDATHRACWLETDRIGYQFNRMIAFPSGRFHSATRHHGRSMQDGRLFQTYRLGVDWDR